MKKIAFYSNQLCLRGTSVAMYDYALYNEKILGNKSFIISDANKDLAALKKFKANFDVYLHNNFEECFNYVRENEIEYIYYIKAGNNDGKIIPGIKNLVHVVFETNEPHGEKYVYIAQWLAEKMCGDSNNFVPHIIHLPTPVDLNLRQKLGIPFEATVLGRHGGMDEFNIGFVHQAIIESLNKRDDLYFVFMNTRPFFEHPRIIHINGTYDLQKKSDYINMCDGMIHARDMGETFGLSIGEFLFFDKPVISCYNASHNIGHRFMLKDKGLWYTNYNECLELILTFNKNNILKNFYYELVSEYTPENVMKRFDKLFLHNNITQK